MLIPARRRRWSRRSATRAAADLLVGLQESEGQSALRRGVQRDEDVCASSFPPFPSSSSSHLLLLELTPLFSQFEKSALHTVEEAQTFGNNFVPAPFWVRVIRVTIPLSTRLEAGKVLIAGIGEEDIQKVVGGREWWQRTDHSDSGVSGEWISLKKDWEGLEKKAKEEEKARAGAKGRDARWEDDLREARLKQLKRDAKEGNSKRRKDGRAKNAAAAGASRVRLCSFYQAELTSLIFRTRYAR